MYALSNQPHGSEKLGTLPGGQVSDDNHTQQHTLRCANCDIDILWPPTIFQGKTYCCTGCAAGGPCNCDYSQYRSVTISGIIHYTPERHTEQT